MKVGLDIDGTIDEKPDFFRLMTKVLIESGHEVHILTYRDDRLEAIADLEKHQISYTALYLPNEGDKHHTWKGVLAGEIGLDMMIDDSPEVLANMPKNVLPLWVCNPEVFDLNKAIEGMRTTPVKRSQFVVDASPKNRNLDPGRV